MADGTQGEPNKPDPAQAFQSLLAKHSNDALAVASKLFDENFTHRQRIRELEGKVPADGTVILSKADAERFEAFKALGKKPDELKQALADAENATNENAVLKKKDILRDVAAAHGYKLSVLQDQDQKSGGLEYKLKDEGKAGETRKVAYVVVEGKESPLEEYAAEQWADYMPALKAEQAQTDVQVGNGRSPKPSGGMNVYDRTREEVKNAAPTEGGANWLARRFGRAASNA